MSPNQRIALNVIATYGRSLVGLLCGLFTSRWALRALGVEAFGVYGVVGVVVSLCSFLNFLLASAVGRYYAFAFGEASNAEAKEPARTKCNEWFNVAVFLHVLLSIVVGTLSYFVGEWAIDNYLKIPSQYNASAHLVLYFSITGMVVGLVSSPFRAMYVAQQYIAEVTIYDLFTPVLNLSCAWALLSYSGDRLVFYAFYMMGIVALPNLLVMIRACFVFPECRFDIGKMWDVEKIKKIFSFAGWVFVGFSGYTIRTQGTSILVNKLLGVQFNSTMGVSNTMVGHASSLSGALTGAFSPAVINAAGAKDVRKFYILAMQSSKIGTMLMALFFIPLSIEIDYVINLWLDTIPPLVDIMCVLAMACAVIERCAAGATIAFAALEKMKVHECLCFVIHLLTVVICYVLVEPFNMGIVGIGWGLVVGTAMISAMRMILWRYQLHLPCKDWLFKFMMPFCLVSALSVAIGYSITQIMGASFLRVLVVGVCSVFALCFGSWVAVFEKEEREFIQARIVSMLIRHR